MTGLRLGWCGHDAALFACRAWHYSRTLPPGRAVTVGAWEDGRFVGCVAFSRGACRHVGCPFGLAQSEVCELTRVALAPRRAPTSRVVAVAVRMLRRLCPGLRLVVSYADPAHGHVGTIYQAMGWMYLGPTAAESLVRVNGRLRHPRSVGSRFGHRGVEWLRRNVDADAERVVVEPKFKYCCPLDAAMWEQLGPLVRPYPRRERSAENGTAVPAAGGGVIPTRSLHTTEAARA